MKSEDLPEKVGKVLSVPLKPILKVAVWASDYTGFGAVFFKPIPVVMMALFIFYPWLSYPLWLRWAHSVPCLWQYVIYVLWLIQFPVIFSVVTFVGYYFFRKAKEIITYKDFQWDVNRSLENYIEFLERRKTSRH